MTLDEGWHWSTGASWIRGRAADRPLGHPPLFFYVLGALDWLGASPYLGRWVSWSSTAGSIAALGGVITLTVGRAFAFPSMMLAAVSFAMFRICWGTRGYATALLFISVGFLLITLGNRIGRLRYALIGLVSVILACGIEYFAVFFVPSAIFLAAYYAGGVSSLFPTRGVAVGVGVVGVALCIATGTLLWTDLSDVAEYVARWHSARGDSPPLQFLTFLKEGIFPGAEWLVLPLMVLGCGSCLWPRARRFEVFSIGVVPVLLHCGVASLGLYPLSGTRHSAHLVLCSGVLLATGLRALAYPLVNVRIVVTVLVVVGGIYARGSFLGEPKLLDMPVPQEEVIREIEDEAGVFPRSSISFIDQYTAFFFLPFLKNEPERRSAIWMEFGGVHYRWWRTRHGRWIVEMTSTAAPWTPAELGGIVSDALPSVRKAVRERGDNDVHNIGFVTAGYVAQSYHAQLIQHAMRERRVNRFIIEKFGFWGVSVVRTDGGGN